jgi:hypothetical protein
MLLTAFFYLFVFKKSSLYFKQHFLRGYLVGEAVFATTARELTLAERKGSVQLTSLSR